MKNIFLFRHIATFFLAVTALNSSLNAQKPIESHTDERYGNTTVVYRDTISDDAALLAQLEKNFGMGDVVRITVAPPKPKPAPVVASKTAPTVASAAKTIAPPLTLAPAKAAPSAAIAPKTAAITVAPRVVKPVATAKAAPAPKAAAPAPVLVHAVTPEPAIAPAPKVNRQLMASTDNPTLLMASLTDPKNTTSEEADATEQVVTATVAPVRQINTTAKSGRTTTAASKSTAKSASKSGKSTKFYKHKGKSGFSVKSFIKKHKPSRQQYKCYKF